VRPVHFEILLSLSATIVASAQPWPGKIELPSFPKPNPVQAFADLKIFDTNGSPIRMPVEDWNRARQLVATNADWQQWIAERRAQADEWMAKRHDKPEWIAGWAHNFVSPEDSSFLTFTPDEPGEETLSSPSDPKVKLTSQLHAAWVYKFRMRHADMMLDAARLYRLTGETNYAQWAKSQINFYTDNLLGWKIHSHARIMFQSLDEAVILIKWVTTARTLGNAVSAKEKTFWSEELFKPEALLLENNFQVIHNIACWHRSAEGQVALYCNDEALWHAAVDATNGIRNQIARGITSDYLWFEQSMGYNAYVTKALVPFFEYAFMEGKGGQLKTEMETVENLLLSPLTMRFPNGQLPNPSDSGRAGYVPSAAALNGEKDASTRANEELPALASASRLFPTQIGLKLIEAAHAKSWELLLDPPVTFAIKAELPVVTSRNLESSRMTILRRGSWQVYFHYGQLAGSHCQAEALNFEAFYNDLGITEDPGTAGYGSKLTAEYFRSGAAHNVPLVDGVGQKAGWGDGSWNPGKLDRFNQTSVSASQTEYRSDARAARSLTIDGDRLRDEVSITTTDGKSHALGFVLNLQGQAKFPDGFTADDDFSKSHRAVGFSHWENVQSMNARDKAVFDVDFGGTILRVEFELPGEFKISHATVPDYPPDHREAFYLETHGTNATMKTMFSKSSK
jgi:hypothetical protein